MINVTSWKTNSLGNNSSASLDPTHPYPLVFFTCCSTSSLDLSCGLSGYLRSIVKIQDLRNSTIEFYMTFELIKCFADHPRWRHQHSVHHVCEMGPLTRACTFPPWVFISTPWGTFEFGNHKTFQQSCTKRT